MPYRPRQRCTSCKALHEGTGLCTECRKAKARARYRRRGTTTERGLGADHRAIAKVVLANATVCALCGLPPTRDDPLTAGHIQAREQQGKNVLENYQAEHRSCGSAKQNPGRHVTLVTGPPCAGKTTYVHAHAQPGDVILDLDQIAREECGSTKYWQHEPHITRRADAIMRQRIWSLAGGRTLHAWVIRSVPSGQARTALARLIRADTTVLLLPPEPTLVRRALARPDRLATIEAINGWLGAYTEADSDTVITVGA